MTAAPGGQRLLHFALVQAVCGTEALGRFANDLSIAMMLGLFSAVGWSALVLARVPVAGEGRAAPVMLGLARGAVVFTLLACLPLPLLAWGGWLFEPGWTALLLAGWTAYTVARHYGLALTCYRPLLVLETLLVVLLAAGIVVDGGQHRWMPYAALAVPTALLGLAGLVHLMRHRGHEAAALPAGSARTAAEQAALNFVSAGMSMILVPREAEGRLAGSYVNFLITNDRIVYPLLDAATDGEAQRILEEIFPEHTVVGVPAREILLGGGNIHCITQQIPSGQ